MQTLIEKAADDHPGQEIAGLLHLGGRSCSDFLLPKWWGRSEVLGNIVNGKLKLEDELSEDIPSLKLTASSPLKMDG